MLGLSPITLVYTGYYTYLRAIEIKMHTMKDLTPTLPLDIVMDDGEVLTYYLHETDNAELVAETLVTTGLFFGLKELDPEKVQEVAFRGIVKKIK